MLTAYLQDEAINMSPTAINVHPLDSSINLSVHQPLYPPGNIIHIVRHHPKDRRFRRHQNYLQNVVLTIFNWFYTFIQSVSYHIGLSLRSKDKNTHIILEKPSIFCKKVFTMALCDFLK